MSFKNCGGTMRETLATRRSEMFSNRYNVLRPLRQRRKIDHNSREALK